jgi:hypothetical protein
VVKPKPKRKKKPQPGGQRALLYKVVELSTVDESSIERTLNEWTPHGWKLDGIQFAMRESSKRPSMAFVFFTREGQAVRAFGNDETTAAERGRSREVAEVRLRHLAGDGAKMPPAVSAWERLAQLAGDDE